MWGASVIGRQRNHHRLNSWGGYENYQALLKDILLEIKNWDDLADIEIKIYWRHPDSRRSKPKETILTGGTRP